MINFHKMNVIGNDFALLDLRKNFNPPELSTEQIQALSHRQTGLGFDQLIMLTTITENRKPRNHLKFYNQDGSYAEACGNGTLCAAKLLFSEGKINFKNKTSFRIHDRLAECKQSKDKKISVNMGTPRLEWDQIPLAKEADTRLFLMEFFGNQNQMAAVNLGNPHIIGIVPYIGQYNLSKYKKRIESHSMIPKPVNFSVVQIQSKDEIIMRTEERGIIKGNQETWACGSAACAALIAIIRRSRVEIENEERQRSEVNRKVKVKFFQNHTGHLEVSWPKDDGPVWLSGPAKHVVSGRISKEFLKEYK